MSEEELYTLALSDIHKYNLLNEIFAIRDKRFLKEQQESMLCVNGYIGIDTLNDYINLINQLQQKENIIKEVREYIKNNWISKKDADNYRFDDEELDIEISDIAVLYDILDKENK